MAQDLATLLYNYIIATLPAKPDLVELGEGEAFPSDGGGLPPKRHTIYLRGDGEQRYYNGQYYITLGGASASARTQGVIPVTVDGQTEFDLTALNVERLDEVRYYGLILEPQQYEVDGTTLRFLETRYALEAGEKFILVFV